MKKLLFVSFLAIGLNVQAQVNSHSLCGIGGLEAILIIIIIVIPLLNIVNVLKNEFKGNDKLMWIIILLCMNIIGVILYKIYGDKNKFL